MKQLTAILAVFTFAVASLHGQQDGARKRGFLPPTFALPGPQEQVHFTSAQSPEFGAPEYPASQRQAGLEAAVEVDLYVTSKGDVVYAEVVVSSGDMQFDQEALRCALQSKFPAGYATVQGQPRDFKIAVPFYFLLSSDPEGYWHSRLELARLQQEYEIVMREFQNFVSARTVTSEDRLNATRTAIEGKVAAAKRLHRLLAEKKELAILRLRDQIASAREILEQGNAGKETEQPVSWRIPDEDQADVAVGARSPGVVSMTHVSTNDIDRLHQELEIKQAYL